MLALELSQREGGIALHDAAGMFHVEHLAATPGRADEGLFPAIDRAFHRARLKPRDLEAVAVSTGPGGFTGLRTAIAATKMLAETLAAKIVAVPTALVVLEACAELANEPAASVVLAVKRDTMWLTHGNRDATGAWEIDPATPPTLVSVADLPRQARAVLVADSHLSTEARHACVQHGIRVLPAAYSPNACLLAGARLHARQEWTDPLHLLPLYAREPEAVSLWRARPQSR